MSISGLEVLPAAPLVPAPPLVPAALMPAPPLRPATLVLELPPVEPERPAICVEGPPAAPDGALIPPLPSGGCPLVPGPGIIDALPP
jgi:hypothetical protein